MTQHANKLRELTHRLFDGRIGIEEYKRALRAHPHPHGALPGRPIRWVDRLDGIISKAHSGKRLNIEEYRIITRIGLMLGFEPIAYLLKELAIDDIEGHQEQANIRDVVINNCEGCMSKTPSPIQPISTEIFNYIERIIHRGDR